MGLPGHKKSEKILGRAGAIPRTPPDGPGGTRSGTKGREKGPPARRPAPARRADAAVQREGSSTAEPPRPRLRRRGPASSLAAAGCAKRVRARELLSRSPPGTCPSGRLSQQYFLLARPQRSAPDATAQVPRDAQEPSVPRERNTCLSQPFCSAGAGAGGQGGASPGAFWGPAGPKPVSVPIAAYLDIEVMRGQRRRLPLLGG